MKKLWLTANTATGPLKVWVVDEIVIDEEELSAVFYKESYQIFVKRACPEIMKMNLHHELLHVCFNPFSGALREKVLGKNPDDREEQVVSLLEPAQFDLLVRNGWLKYPEPP